MVIRHLTQSPQSRRRDHEKPSLTALAVLGTAGHFAEAQSKKVMSLSAQISGQGFTGTIEKIVAEY
jgi:hypothetical protein